MNLSTRRESALDLASSGRAEGTPRSPDARRPIRRSWRDPRLWVGVSIVAVCMLLGAQVLAAADDSVRVWAAAHRLNPGSPVTQADLEPRRVRFASPSQADRYLSADRGLPAQMVLDRAVLPGELVPRSALRPAGTSSIVEVPLPVAADRVPSGLRDGDVVDVWVAPTQRSNVAGEGPAPAVRVLQEVVVVASSGASSAFGPAGTRQVVVGVPPGEEDLLATALALISDGDPLIVRRS
jgi:hypothetical protein